MGQVSLAGPVKTKAPAEKDGADENNAGLSRPAAVIPAPIPRSPLEPDTEAVKLLKSGPTAERLKAIDRLSDPKRLDAAGIGALVSALGTEDYPVRQKAEKALVDIAVAASKDPGTRLRTKEIGLALEKTLGTDSTNDQIRQSLSSRIVLQNLIHQISAQSENRDLIQPVVDKLVRNVVTVSSSHSSQRSASLSNAALQMAVSSQRFDESRITFFGTEQVPERLSTLPRVYQQAIESAVGSKPKSDYLQRGAELLGYVAATLPGHLPMIEVRCGQWVDTLGPKFSAPATTALAARNITPRPGSMFASDDSRSSPIAGR